MANDLVRTATKIEIGKTREGFFLYVENLACNLHLPCGQAITAALLMKANGVRFFDYHPTLFSDEAATSEFIGAANAVGFEV